ncbi:WD40-repeat-containing domain protein [Lentinula raphanica]|nr:WD40-repeat-containing domain protein [Lentinula raphanica]
MSSSAIHTVRIVTVQATFPTVVNEVYSGVIPFENVWISCYDNSPAETRQPDPPGSIYAKVRVVLDDEDREKVVFRAREGDVLLSEAERRNFGYVYTVSLPSMQVPPTRLLFPVQEYADPERSNPQKPHRITAFTLSPDRSQYATGYLDGSVLLYPTVPIHNSQNKYPTSSMYSPSKSTYTSRRQALVSTTSTNVSPALHKAHKSTVTSLRFFPSSRVLLSTGADFTLHIFPADPIPASMASSESSQSSKRVSSVRTLIAHTRSVTSSAMIDRGRSIISASTDGTIRVWDVSTGKEETLIHSATGVGVGVNCISLDFNRMSTGDSTERPLARRLYAALHDGSFEVLNLDLEEKPPKISQHFRSENLGHGALNAIAVSQPTGIEEITYIAVGSAKGVVSVYNANTYASAHFRRSDASIEDLEFIVLENNPNKLGLVVATADGLPWIASLTDLPVSGECNTQVSVYAELVGGDVDAVRHVCVHTADTQVEVWTASDDGIVRRYIL